MKRLTFEIPAEQHAAFKATAAQYGLSISAYARAQLFQFPDLLERKENESHTQPVPNEKPDEHPRRR